MRSLSILLVPLLATAVTAAEGVTVGQWNGMLMVTAPATVGISAIGDRAAQRITLDARDQPLTDTIEYLRTATGLTFVVAPAVQANPPVVNLQVKEMALGSVLRWIERIGSVHIGFVNGALFVSDKPVEGASTTRLYDVRDLSFKVPDFPGPSLAIPEAGGSGSALLAPPTGDDTRQTPDLNEIQQFIERFVTSK